MGAVLAWQDDARRLLTAQPRRVAVVQAHSGDFVGGCGGFICFLVGQGSAVTLITLFGSGRDPEERRIREEEIAEAATTLGIQAGPPIGRPEEKEVVARTVTPRSSGLGSQPLCHP